jgi:hypothetical protein
MSTGLKKEKAMLKKITFMLILVVLCFYSAWAENLVSPLQAKEVAQELIQRNVVYYSVHPEEAGNIPEWKWSKLEDPILVHTYPDLRPCYYMVPVVNMENQIISLIGVDAKSQEWQWFSRVRLEKFPKVSKSQASQICEKRTHNPTTSEPKIVEMPNKKLYWLCSVNAHDLKEIFVNIDNVLEVHTNLDPDISDLTTSSEPIPVHPHHPQKVGESFERKSLLYPPSYNIQVPFYYQITPWYCGEAALEMMFDYWGPDISQDDIGDVANDDPSYGTYSDDLRRASHFSYISPAIQNPSLQGYNQRDLGYSSNDVFWSEPVLYPDRYDDLKNLISNDYPIIVLTWYSAGHASGHFRVVKGYNDSLNYFFVHDPWYSPPYSGPDVHFNQSFFVDNLWEYSDRWGLFSCPWLVEMAVDSLVGIDQLFMVKVEFTYTAFHPFENQFLADSISATIFLPPGYQLISPPSATINFGYQYSGFVGNPIWQIQAPSDSSGPDTFRVEVKGKITGSSYSYTDYQDWIGGEGEAKVITLTYICGDANRDGNVNSADVTYLINYLFVGGPPPVPSKAGDANHDSVINSADAAYLINYLFVGGPPPSI